MNTRVCCWTIAACGALFTVGAQAQPVASASVSLEAETDRRERGLSWSDGKPALSVFATVPSGDALAFDLGAATLRDSARHGGADVALTIAPRYTVYTGGFALSAGARGNVFIGRSGMTYAEITGEVARTIGPVQLVLGADFAPSQDSIGGHNLHVDASASAGIPGLPFTLYGGVGRTSGSSRDDARSARLRPGGTYTDYHLGIERSRALLSVGVRYSDTSIGKNEVDRLSPYYDQHFGSRIVGYLRIST
ncbi:TorF family putative porin [Novosphingobium sp. M1R2S20]|uniref:TorF family putative porin n=1 Tax=Novosphingobium rhizovicinum TaxID=3228928 RepID=A0ABV3RCN3_9SPHN